MLNEERVELIGASKAFINELEKQFATVIDRRDWKNLDLIIYFLETGRADSRKEALQLVDKEMQANTIVKALGIAAQEIRDTIRDGLNQVRNDMVQCFSIMGRLISETAENQMRLQRSMHEAQMSAIRESSAYNEAMYRGMSQLVTATNLQSALVAKAAASSEQLAGDVGYIKSLSENAEIRRRNNLS